MSGLNELYQQVIIDHGRRPRNFAASPQANAVLEGYNPLCGDRLTVYLTEQAGMVQDVTFQGSGCAISMASASLMTEAVKGKSCAEAVALFEDFQRLVTHGQEPELLERLGKLCVFAGVSEYPARVKCATLGWHALLGAIRHEQTPVTSDESDPNN